VAYLRNEKSIKASHIPLASGIFVPPRGKKARR
jgi:hypothetical protein